MGRLRASVNDTFFSHNTPESFYWAGFIAADGCILGNNRMSLYLASKDKNHVEKLTKALDYDGKICYSRVRNAYGVSITSERIVMDLQRFNIFERKSLTYKFPEFVIGHNFCNHFMRGYFDGDGSFNIDSRLKTKQLRFALRGTVEFLTTYRNILETACGFEKRERSIPIESGCGNLSYSGRLKPSKIVDFLYKNSSDAIQLQRKYDVSHLSIFREKLNFNFSKKSVIGTNINDGQKIILGSMKEAESCGFRYQGISACCRGESKFHKGYTWRYAN